MDLEVKLNRWAFDLVNWQDKLLRRGFCWEEGEGGDIQVDFFYSFFTDLSAWGMPVSRADTIFLFFRVKLNELFTGRISW